MQCRCRAALKACARAWLHAWEPQGGQGVHGAHVSVLLGCRSAWEALGPPTECLGLDFYDSAANMQPACSELALPISERGVCNAMAFWFELHLDEQVSLSTGPYADKARALVPPACTSTVQSAGAWHWSNSPPPVALARECTAAVLVPG